MSEAATETPPVTEEHTTPEHAPSEELHVGEQLGSLCARMDALESVVNGLAAAQSRTEEDVERAEEQAERATDVAIEASVDAAQAESTAEVAEAVAVAAAEVAVEAEETAEEVEEVVDEELSPEGDESGEVTEVPAEEVTTEETSSPRKRRSRRGLYGRR